MGLWLLMLLANLFGHPRAQASELAMVRCASELKRIHANEFAANFFVENNMIVGSVRSRPAGGERDEIWLLLANEHTSRAFKIRPASRRFRLEFPNADPRLGSELLFLHYSHSDIYGSRLGYLLAQLPPQGSAPSDYTEVRELPLPAGTARAKVLQLLSAEVERVSHYFRIGKLTRNELLAGNISFCRGLAASDSALARLFDKQIGELEFASTPARTLNRIPAGF
jgi:hypothetical protein